MRTLQALTIAGAGVLAAMLTNTSPAEAQWCAVYQFGGRTCFKSEGQCRATISGAGGSCNYEGQRIEETERPVRRAEPPKRERRERAAPATPAKKTVTPPTAAPVAPSAPAAPAASGMTANFAAARKLVLDGQYQAGLKALQSLGFDDHPDVAAYIGLAYNKLGRPEEARVWYDRALAANPNHLLTLSFDGMLHSERGNVRGAQANLDKLRALCSTTCNEYLALEAALSLKR